MSDKNQPLQSSEYGGMSIEELATASTVYRADLLTVRRLLFPAQGRVWDALWLFWQHVWAPMS